MYAIRKVASRKVGSEQILAHRIPQKLKTFELQAHPRWLQMRHSQYLPGTEVLQVQYKHRDQIPTLVNIFLFLLPTPLLNGRK